MLKLNLDCLMKKELWQSVGIELPLFDIEKMRTATSQKPEWIHFGAGNIYRGFIAALAQKLLNEGKLDTGIITVETFDYEIIEKIYKPYDNLCLLSIMNADGSLKNKVIASIPYGMAVDNLIGTEWDKLKQMFTEPSLKMTSFTITEKGYNIKKLSGDYLDDVLYDLDNGPNCPKHLMAKLTSLLYTRFKKGKYPVAMVSMDNCSHNGDKLHSSVEEIARYWVDKGLIERDFLEYINNPKLVSFPWTMIDKITPRPSDSVKHALNKLGFEDTDIICTNKNTYIAPFINAEEIEYLVIEDSFPNGRIPLDNAGVIFTDRDTVNNVEKMKVCTCLNPLHTSLAVFGCLLGYNLIADEMKDSALIKLVEKVGYEEGLPVVVNPGIINPNDFIKEVIEKRIPNPFIPDTPQRIATDTSLKVGIRFGETIKAYIKRSDLNSANLKYIPLVIAGWCRYLLAVDDNLVEMQLSSDPRLEELRNYLKDVKLCDTASAKGCLKPILSNENIFGIDLYKAGLGEKVEEYFEELISGKGAVRRTLEKYLV